jgi:hypothetical protein
MRTPAGKECPWFYGDYHRGRNIEECRLLKAAGEKWSRDLCTHCPVPAITLANACEHMRLRLKIQRPLAALFQRRVHVSAFCDKVKREVSEPQIGCGECHYLPIDIKVSDG